MFSVFLPGPTIVRFLILAFQFTLERMRLKIRSQYCLNFANSSRKDNFWSFEDHSRHSFFCPTDSLRGRRSKGKGQPARGRREGNSLPRPSRSPMILPFPSPSKGCRHACHANLVARVRFSSPRTRTLRCFPLCQRFRKFRSEIKWKGPFRFLPTGIFGNTSGGGPLISVGIFRPKFAVPFLTNRFFALIREFGKGIKSGKSHSYWLARFNRKMSFHFPSVAP